MQNSRSTWVLYVPRAFFFSPWSRLPAICRYFRGALGRTRTCDLLCSQSEAPCFHMLLVVAENPHSQAEMLPSSLPGVPRCGLGLVSKLVSKRVVRPLSYYRALTLPYLEPPPIGDFSWPEAGSTLPTVASPSFSYEPAYSDNHVREGDPKFDDPIPALSTPHELLVGVLPGVCALHDPAFCACQRSRFPFLGDPRDQATGL